MHPERQRPEQMPHIAIRLVKAALLELFHHHTALHFEALLAESQLQHTVGLQPEGRLHIRLGNGEVIVGDVIIGPRIVFAARQLQRSVIVGNMHGTAEHQVFEQMGKPRVLGMLVAGADIIHDVQRHHLRAGVLAMHQPQAVGEPMYLPVILCRRIPCQGLTQRLSVNHSHLHRSSHPLPDGRCGLSSPAVSYLPHPCLQALRRTRCIRRPDGGVPPTVV